MLIDSLKQLTSGAAAVNSTGKTTKSQTAETSSATSAQSRGGVLQQQLETLSRWSISKSVSFINSWNS
jgi:hypothetical protein